MHDSLPERALPKPKSGWFWSPYFQIFLTVSFTAVAQILLKVGSSSSAGDNSVAAWLGIKELGNGWIWLGVLAFIASFGSWLYALRFLPLGVAFALTNGAQILVPIGAWLFLHEQFGPMRISGIAVIIVGILLLGQSVARAEEKV